MALRGHSLRGVQSPFLRCLECDLKITYLHHELCPCGENYLSNHPCGHEADIYSICPTWTAYGGCQCIDSENHDS